MTENSPGDISSCPDPKKVKTKEPLSCQGGMEGCISLWEKYNILWMNIIHGEWGGSY